MGRPTGVAGPRNREAEVDYRRMRRRAAVTKSASILRDDVVTAVPLAKMDDSPSTALPADPRNRPAIGAIRGIVERSIAVDEEQEHIPVSQVIRVLAS